MSVESKEILIFKRSFYIYNTPGEYIFIPRFSGEHKITVVGGGGGGYGGSGCSDDTYPYQSAGGGGGGTASGVFRLEVGIEYSLTVGSGGAGGSGSSRPNTMNCGRDGGDSSFADKLFAEGGAGWCHYTQDKNYALDRKCVAVGSGCGGRAYGGEKNICGEHGRGGYYLMSEKMYSSGRKSGGNSTHGDGGIAAPYRKLRQRGFSFGGADGIDGTGHGAGGGGAGFYSYVKGGFSGGSGSCGLIIIEESELDGQNMPTTELYKL